RQPSAPFGGSDGLVCLYDHRTRAELRSLPRRRGRERRDTMRGRFFSTIVLVLGAALATATLAAAAAPIPTNFNVTAMPGNEAEAAIAVNPTNPSNAVAMSTLPDVVAGLAVGVSFNSGHTWSRSVIGSTTADPLGDICCDQQLAWDRFGNLWMT